MKSYPNLISTQFSNFVNFTRDLTTKTTFINLIHNLCEFE